LTLSQCNHSEELPEDVLAAVGDYDITTSEFTNTFNEVYLKTGQALAPDIETRRALLMNDLNRYIIANHAIKNGMDKTEIGIRRLQRVKRRVINDEVQQRIILSTIEVNDEDLNEVFLRFNTRLRASHLVSPTKKGANELLRRVESGESFESIATEVFQNPTLASNGGDIGWFTVDEMDVAFEEAAYSMTVGEISEPVRTSQGYSIIKLTGRQQTPILTQQQFARAKPQLHSYVAGKKEELAVREHLQIFLDSSRVSLDIADLLLERLNPTEGEFLDISNIASERLLTFKEFEFNVSDFEKEFGLNPERENIFLSNRSAFLNLIKALAYRNYLFRLGLAHGIDEYKNVIASIEETYSYELEKLVTEEFSKRVNVTEEAIIQEYQSNENRFVEPIRVNLRRLKVDNKPLAELLLEQMKQGVPMEDLIASHSIDPQDRLLRGELGYRSIQAFGAYAQQLAVLKVGEISEIFDYSSNEYHIYECLGRQESRQLSFVEAYSQVEQVLMQKQIQDVKHDLIQQSLESEEAIINQNLLDTFRIEIYN